MIPFFVADRPASLAILRGVFIKYPKVKIGLMTHTFTSANFWNLFKVFPFKTLPCYQRLDNCNKKENALANSIIKMADSGIFCKNGCTIGYEELFERYNNLGIQYGIMIDVLKDSKATLKSAERARRIFDKNRKKYKFKLIAVAQGKSLQEYLDCYAKLRKNFKYIAIGGLLKKYLNSARYVRVQDDELLYEILRKIKETFKPKWIFALGCYHPKRHDHLEKIGVWGSDYKGWIFNYIDKFTLLKKVNYKLVALEKSDGLKKRTAKRVKIISDLEMKIKNTESKWRMERDEAKKKHFHSKVLSSRRQISNEYTKIYLSRQKIVDENGLSRDYRRLLRLSNRYLSSDEQRLRFKQVRDYIDNNVYSKLLK